jgi:hypothetical protein
LNSKGIANILALCALTNCNGGGEIANVAGASIEVVVAPLTLPGVGKICYDVKVTDGPTKDAPAIWSRGAPGLNDPAVQADTGALCSSNFGNGPGGDITFVGACVATPFDSGQTYRTNSVTLWLDGLYDDAQSYIPPTGAQGWRNPCPDGCTLTAQCRENSDTLVEFNLTILREANQGFFDIGVNFQDIFCSAKVDCRDANAEPLRLLFNGGERDTTVVSAFACTAGPGAGTTELYRDDLVISCGSGPGTTTATIDPATGKGNGYTAANPDPDLDDAIWQYAIYAGEEAITCNGQPCNKRYWNVALGLDDTLPDCVLTTQMTAGAPGDLTDASTPEGHTYPFITVTVPLTGAEGLVCTKHPLDGGNGVSTSYTPIDAPATFDAKFSGQLSRGDGAGGGDLVGAGGVVTHLGGYRVHTFTTSGTFTVTAGTGTAEVLIVGGGGGGGGDNAGGGGAGGVVVTTVSLTSSTYAITVGAGGAGGQGTVNANGQRGSKGGDSSFAGLAAIGGGGGGGGQSNASQKDGGAGGSGGGGGGSYPTYDTGGSGGAATTGQGFAGARGLPSQEAGGGGGGAGGPGLSQDGGPGVTSTLAGVSSQYGGGGGGGAWFGGVGYRAGNASAGGGYGGGNLSITQSGGHGLPNTGGGGGGGGETSNGGSGGSGIVIVRYYNPALNPDGPPSRLALSLNDSSVLVQECTSLSIRLEDSSGNIVASEVPTAVALSTSGGSGAFYSDGLCTAPITTTNLPALMLGANLYYRPTSEGTLTLQATATSGQLSAGSAPLTARQLVAVTSGLVLLLSASDATSAGFPGIGCSATSWLNLVNSSLTNTLTNFSACGLASGWNGSGTSTDPHRLSLDGSNDYVRLPASLTAGLTRFTVGLWVRTTESRSNATYWQRPALFQHTNGSAPDQDFGLNLNGGYIGMWSGFNPSGDNSVVSTKLVNDNKWHYVTVTSDGTTVRLFVDGTHTGATLNAGGRGFSNTGFFIGAGNGEQHGIGAGFFSQSEIAAFHLYNADLTSSQVAQNCNAMKSAFQGATCAP